MAPAAAKMRALILTPLSCFPNVIKCIKLGSTVSPQLHVEIANGSRALWAALLCSADRKLAGPKTSSGKGCDSQHSSFRVDDSEGALDMTLNSYPPLGVPSEWVLRVPPACVCALKEYREYTILGRSKLKMQAAQQCSRCLVSHFIHFKNGLPFKKCNVHLIISFQKWSFSLSSQPFHILILKLII